MACGTIVGQALLMGVASDEASLVTQAVKATRKSSKVEAKDKCGITVSVAYFNLMADITIEGLGTSTAAIASTLTLANSLGLGAGLVYVEEVEVSLQNEQFVKSSIKAVQYSGITS